MLYQVVLTAALVSGHKLRRNAFHQFPIIAGDKRQRAGVVPACLRLFKFTALVLFAAYGIPKAALGKRLPIILVDQPSPHAG